MNGRYQPIVRRFYTIVAAISIIALLAIPAMSGEYAAM
jgi:hypothetical protein